MPTFTRRDIVRIGVFAGADERTVKDFLLGRRRTHPLVVAAITRAMRELGYPETPVSVQP